MLFPLRLREKKKKKTSAQLLFTLEENDMCMIDL